MSDQVKDIFGIYLEGLVRLTRDFPDGSSKTAVDALIEHTKTTFGPDDDRTLAVMDQLSILSDDEHDIDVVARGRRSVRPCSAACTERRYPTLVH